MSFCDNSLISIFEHLFFDCRLASYKAILSLVFFIRSSLEFKTEMIDTRSAIAGDESQKKQSFSVTRFICMLFDVTQKMRKMLRGILLMRQSSELTPYHDTKRSNEHKWQTEETKLSSLFQDLLSLQEKPPRSQREKTQDWIFDRLFSFNRVWCDSMQLTLEWSPLQFIQNRDANHEPKLRRREDPLDEEDQMTRIPNKKWKASRDRTTRIAFSLILLLQTNDYKQNTNSWLLSLLLLLPLLCSTLYFRCKTSHFQKILRWFSWLKTFLSLCNSCLLVCSLSVLQLGLCLFWSFALLFHVIIQVQYQEIHVKEMNNLYLHVIQGEE